MITIKVDTSDATRWLNNLQRKQIPFAASVALNRTAQDVQRGLVSGMSIFDRPKPFTLRGVYVDRSTKTNLTATIGLKTRDKGGPVNEYLAANIAGGGRVDKRSEILLRNAGILPPGMQTRPGPDARLDAYGNMSRGQIVQIISYFKAFGSVATSGRGRAGGTKSARLNASARKTRTRAMFATQTGVYERKRGTVLGLITFTRPERYQKRYDFSRISDDIVQRRWDVNFKTALAYAMETAR